MKAGVAGDSRAVRSNGSAGRMASPQGRGQAVLSPVNVVFRRIIGNYSEGLLLRTVTAMLDPGGREMDDAARIRKRSGKADAAAQVDELDATLELFFYSYSRLIAGSDAHLSRLSLGRV